MDRITVGKEIRSQEPDKTKAFIIRIFASTANGKQQDRDECLARRMMGTSPNL